MRDGPRFGGYDLGAIGRRIPGAETFWVLAAVYRAGARTGRLAHGRPAVRLAGLLVLVAVVALTGADAVDGFLDLGAAGEVAFVLSGLLLLFLNAGRPNISRWIALLAAAVVLIVALAVNGIVGLPAVLTLLLSPVFVAVFAVGLRRAAAGQRWDRLLH